MPLVIGHVGLAAELGMHLDHDCLMVAEMEGFAEVRDESNHAPQSGFRLLGAPTDPGRKSQPTNGDYKWSASSVKVTWFGANQAVTWSLPTVCKQ
jgi:hypothetical protein